jgi:ABC-2 type transport system permease protein
MNKILLVAKREFLSRVKKKTFLLATIGLPLMISAIYALIIYFAVDGGKTKDKVAIVDEVGLFANGLDSNKAKLFFIVKNESAEAYKDKFEKEGYEGYLSVPKTFDINKADSLKYYGKSQLGIIQKESLAKMVNDAIFRTRLAASNISSKLVDSAKADVQLSTVTIENGKEKTGSVEAATMIAFGVGILTYMLIFIYGNMVMMGVMEEKTNRIAEVIVSSMKPFQLMMGKILGIGSVGLVQFGIWIVLTIALNLLLPLFMSSNITDQVANQVSNSGVDMTQAKAAGFSLLDRFLTGVPIAKVLICFPLFFLGGYLQYSSLFAAVGSTVNDSPQEAQQLTLPLTLPIIFSMVIMMKAVQAPNSGIAIFGSMFPLTSPIVMMARVPFDIPTWQIVLSLVLLIASFIGTTWLAGKIYRVGILMYGKKTSWKEMLKWAFRKA